MKNDKELFRIIKAGAEEATKRQLALAEDRDIVLRELAYLDWKDSMKERGLWLSLSEAHAKRKKTDVPTPEELDFEFDE